MGRISTHILDTSRGRPAEGVRIEVYAVDGEKRTLLGQTVTNADGRTDEPVVAMPDIPPGTYELLFHVGPYLTMPSTTSCRFAFAFRTARGIIMYLY